MAPRTGTGASFIRWNVLFGLLAIQLASTERIGALPTSTAAGGSNTARRLAISQATLRAIEGTGWADVLVGLASPVAPSVPLNQLARGVAVVQDQALDGLEASEFRLSKRYEYFPMLAGRVSAAGLAKLRANPIVTSVDEDVWVYPLTEPASLTALAESVPSIQADKAHALGIKGKGIGVAVVDTGIDNDHPDLVDAIVDQQCFSASTRSCAPTGLPRSDNAEDEHGHGTAVSGIVLSRGKAAPIGVAPEASLIGVRVFQDAGGAPTQDIVDGLNWVVGKQSTDHIRVVNMSLGGGAAIGTNCDDQYASVKQVFQTLVSRNIAVFVATGNGGNSDRVAFPACISNAIGIGSTWDASLTLGSPDCHGKTTVGPFDITCYTDRGRAMDLVAPGSVIVSSKMGGGATMGGHGTSFASPHAAGVAALIFSAAPSLYARDIERVMQNNGDDVIHPESGIVIERVNALKAVLAVLPETATPTATRTPSRTPTGSPQTETPTLTPSATPDSITPTASRTPTRTPEGTGSPTGAPHFAVFMPSLRLRVR